MAKLTRSTLNQQVYNRLQRLLLRGELTPGSQLDERALADQMGVSRTPLREAIGQLVKEGIIEYRPYRGNFVRTFSAKEVDDLFQVRIPLESLAMRLAIPKLSQEDIGHIRAILDEVSAALERGDMDGYAAADRHFHSTIVRITGNQPLLEALDRLGMQIQLVRTLANKDPEVGARTERERPLILAALEARDADEAARLMEAHVDGVRRAVVAQIESRERAEAAATG